LALRLLAKAAAILTLMLVLLATAPLEATFKAAHALRVPGLLVQLAMLTMRYTFLFGTELTRMRVALRVRGYRSRVARHSYRTIGHVAGTLLVRGYERAERVGQAMRCRGFDGRFRSLTEFHHDEGRAVLRRTCGRDGVAGGVGLVAALSCSVPDASVTIGKL
jgi:cobalt/nickel transport system permease protein